MVTTLICWITFFKKKKNRLQQLILHFSICLEEKYVPDSTYYAKMLQLAFVYLFTFVGRGKNNIFQVANRLYLAGVQNQSRVSIWITRNSYRKSKNILYKTNRNHFHMELHLSESLLFFSFSIVNLNGPLKYKITITLSNLISTFECEWLENNLFFKNRN